MESAEPRRASGHTGARLAGDRNEPHAASAVNAHHAEGEAAEPQEEHARDRPAGIAPGQAAVASQGVIASYRKCKGVDGGAGQPGGEQGKKPVPVPPALLIGANLDVRV
mgnify:CR=1 FL=1|jgi:hypothetical protein